MLCYIYMSMIYAIEVSNKKRHDIGRFELIEFCASERYNESSATDSCP